MKRIALAAASTVGIGIALLGAAAPALADNHQKDPPITKQQCTDGGGYISYLGQDFPGGPTNIMCVGGQWNDWYVQYS